MKGLIAEFKSFLFQASLITLAVAVVMGTVTAALIKALVADILTPIIALIFGKANFASLTFTINHSHFLYGDLVNVALTFFFTAVAIFFFVVKPYELFQKDDTSVRSCPECTSSISAKATRCPFCTAAVTAAGV
ncbi:MscL family protein [Conexibacter sp. DBS9H8]|uniref:MscL family protein n=1 Tax=Conexibacter sp. DBS9H8 TaxID=2937801 RepID=UPI00200FEF75|nr:MscL family protein [Conexibacter sp. DBS9H8]